MHRVSITGADVAVALALRKMIADKTALPRALKTRVAAVSVGIVSGEEMIDLGYAEDSRAEVDFNIVMTGEGKFSQVQGTAEGEPFAHESMNRLIDLARTGIGELKKAQTMGLNTRQIFDLTHTHYCRKFTASKSLSVAFCRMAPGLR